MSSYPPSVTNNEDEEGEDEEEEEVDDDEDGFGSITEDEDEDEDITDQDEEDEDDESDVEHGGDSGLRKRRKVKMRRKRKKLRRGSGMSNSGMKEQMYRDKLSDLKKQLDQLERGIHPEHVRRLKRLEDKFRERRKANEVIRELEVEMVETDFINEKKSAAREFEDHKVYLREQLIAELEEKQKLVESERHGMELTGDSMELKAVVTRKLRRRPNENNNNSANNGSGIMIDGKKRGGGGGKILCHPSQMNQMSFTLTDSEIIDDLRIINKNKAFSASYRSSSSHHLNSPSSTGSSSAGSIMSSPTHQWNNYYNYQQQQQQLQQHPGSGLYDAVRIEDGKVFFQRRWFRRGQAITVEPRDSAPYPATISTIGPDVVWVRKSGGGEGSSKVRISLNNLTKGKVSIKRRSS